MPLVSARVVSLISPDAISASAYAGDDQSILCETLVQLQGEILGDDLANHTFEWEQSSGPVIVLINPNTLTPSFLDSGAADIEITLYVDRGTPYESSSTVLISSTPATTQRGTAMTSYAQQNSPTTTGSFSAFKSSGMGLQDSIDIDFSVGAYSYNYPPDSTYSPIYKAEDLVRIKEKLDGNYWLMNDIDLSDYDNWNPIGTAARPFSGELQGNGYVLDGLTITDTPLVPFQGDSSYNSVVLLMPFDGDFTDFSSSSASISTTTYNNVSFDNSDTLYGADSLYFSGTGINNTLEIDNSSSSWDIGGADFTFECWINKSTHNATNTICKFSAFQIKFRNTSSQLAYYKSSNGSGVTLWNGTTITPNGWFHLAYVRQDNKVHTYIDGVLDVTHTLPVSPDPWEFYAPGTAQTAYISNNSPTSNNGLEDAHVEDVRLTIGEARYPDGTTFTPPTKRLDQSINGIKPAGLFAYIGNGAVIEQVGVTNASISGADGSVYKGILAGSAQGPSTDDGGAVTIRDVYVDGTVASGGDNAGGLIGHTGANASTIIENTYADVAVTELGTDPIFDKVQFLASFDGADLSQVYTEQSQNALVGTFQTGSSRIRTTAFNSSPSSYNNNSGTARLEFPNDAALQLGSGDFTIEFFIRAVAFTAGTQFIAGHYGTAGNQPWAVLASGTGANVIIRFNGATVATVATANTSMVIDTWYHVVLERTGSDWHFGLNGFREQTGVGGLVGAMQTSDEPLTWGGNFNSGPIAFWNGFIDDARITIGANRYNLASTSTYDIPATPFPTTSINAGAGGWASYFDTTATYNDNYWNASKISDGTGSGGDTPIAGEVGGLTTAQLTAEANYTDWNFTDAWEIDEGVSAATLQNNIFDRVANEGAWLTSGLPQAALWNPPEVSTGGNTQIENKRYLGLIIEDQNPATGGWENKRFIPFEQQSALLTPGRRHRAFTVLNVEPKTKSYDRTREVTYKLPNTIVPKTETDNAVFAGGTTPLASVAYPGATSVSRDIIITKTNPRKISKSVDEDAYYVQNSKDAVSKVLALDKYVGAAKSLDTVLTTEASGTLGIGSATIAIDISITRAYGGSIGG